MRACEVFRIVALLASVAFVTGQAALARAAHGYGAMGDSMTNARPGRTFDDSWVPHLSLTRGLNFGGPGDPYNVAIAGIETRGLLQQGEHTAIRNLVQAGSVDIAFHLNGNNDLLREFAAIKDGTLSGQVLTDWVNVRMGYVATALDTVLGANPTGLVLIGCADITLTPNGRNTYSTPTDIARATVVVDTFNAGLRQLAHDRGLPYVDLATAHRSLDDQPLVVGGVTIDVIHAGGPDHFFLDGVHPGWIGNPILANLFSTAVNLLYGTAIAPLSDLEILTNAGIANQYTGETYSPVVDYAQFIDVPQIGDMNYDGIVNLVDVQVVGQHWNQASRIGDANYDRLVNLVDVQVVGQNWTPPAAVGVPEPASLLLLSAGACGLLLARRRASLAGQAR